MKLFVGLGNPGTKYAGNRHNIGFMALDAIHRKNTFSPWSKKFKALISEGELAGEKVLLIKPQSFMNLSGESVGEAMRFYKSTTDQVIAFYDELDLAEGRFRMKTGGGAAGHNGVRSMMAHVGHDFRRARMGIGHPGQRELVMPYVLGDFYKVELAWRDPLLRACAEALPFAAAGDDERYQAEVMRLAPSPKADPRKAAREG